MLLESIGGVRPRCVSRDGTSTFNLPHCSHIELILLPGGPLFAVDQPRWRKIRNGRTLIFKMAEFSFEVIQRAPAQASEDIQFKIFHHTDGTFFRRKVIKTQLTRPAFSPVTQHLQHPLKILAAVTDNDIRIESEP